MSTSASNPAAPIRHEPTSLALWTRVTTAIASVVVSLTLLGTVAIGLTTPTFDLAAVAADVGRSFDPMVAVAQISADD